MVDLSVMEKKHARNFSLDVHPYMLTIRKPKVEAVITEPLPSEHNIDTVYLEGTHTIVHVSGAITGKPDLRSCSIWFYPVQCSFHLNQPLLANRQMQHPISSICTLHPQNLPVQLLLNFEADIFFKKGTHCLYFDFSLPLPCLFFPRN